MKFKFVENFIQATAESIEENVQLIKLKTEIGDQSIKYHNMSNGAHKGWKTRRMVKRGEKAWATRVARNPEKTKADTQRMLKARWGERLKQAPLLQQERI